ncbi:MAG: response regulator [Flavipsychrobacter sp.]|nr:response regulator [Flavipsychrobacter sp.]
MIQSNINYIVIDDDPINNMICRKIIKLTIPDTNVDTFIQPEKGLDHILSAYSKADAPNAILFLDINMPTLTGWEVMERFKDFPEEVKQHITIYILSSSVDLQDREKAENDPYVKDYIIKPLSQAKLRDINNGTYKI